MFVDAAFIVVMSEEEGGVNTALWQSACLALARPCVSSPIPQKKPIKPQRNKGEEKHHLTQVIERDKGASVGGLGH